MDSSDEKPVYIGKRLTKRIKDFMENIPENKQCINCLEYNPSHIVMDLHVFVCQTCSDIHREFGHRVSSIDNSAWSDEEVIQVVKGGNKRAVKKWLEGWNAEFFPRPASSDPDRIKEFVRKAYIIKCWQAQPKRRNPTPSSASSTSSEEATETVTPDVKPKEKQDPIEAESKPTEAERPARSSEAAVGGDKSQPFDPKAWVPVETHQAYFCPDHCTSDKRKKEEPSTKPCRGCKIGLHTNYSSFAYCPGCSNKYKSCMICGVTEQESVGSSTASTSAGDADSDGGSAEMQPAPRAAPVNLLDDLMDLALPVVTSQPSITQQPAASGANSSLDSVFFGQPQQTIASTPTQGAAVDFNPDLSFEADFQNAATDNAVCTGLSAISFDAAPVTTQPAAAELSTLAFDAPKQVGAVENSSRTPASSDPFASIKDLYNSAPEIAPAASTGYNVLLQAPAPQPGSNAFQTMDASQLVQMQSMIAQTLQQRAGAPTFANTNNNSKPMSAACVMQQQFRPANQPTQQETFSFHALEANTLPCKSSGQGDFGDLITAMQEKPLSHAPAKQVPVKQAPAGEAQFDDLLSAMQQKSAAWEVKGTARPVPAGFDLLY